MGVEIKPYPGVHILVIFHDNVVCEDVESFLNDGLDGKFVDDNGDPEPALKWNITQTFEEVERRFQNKAFIIAPHVDSSFGLYETLKGLGPARIDAFKHHMLKGISFNNSENRERIRHMLSGQDYKRKSPLAFIQSSDFHGQKGYDIGLMHTKIKFGNRRVNYNSVFDLMSSESNVKCSVDTVTDTYNSLIEGMSVVKFQSYVDSKMIFNEDDYRNLSDYVCAFLNTNGGIIDINGNVKIEIDKSEILKELEDDMCKILYNRLGVKEIKYHIKSLQMSNSKYKVLIMYLRSNKLHMSEGKVLILKSDKPMPAAPHEIEYVVTTNLRDKYIKNVENSLDDISFEARRLSEAQAAYPILTNCDIYLENTFFKNLKSKYIIVNDDINELEESIQKHQNGLSDGNMSVSLSPQEPRYKDSYLRYTIPAFNVDLTKIEINKQAVLCDKKGLIVVPLGGSYIQKENKHLHTKQPTFYITTKNDDYCVDFLMAWVKSSFFIWYCLTVLGTADLYLILRRRDRKLPLPKQDIYNSMKTDIGNYVNNIIIEEDKFLKDAVKIEDKKEDNKHLADLVAKHNSSLDRICFSLDLCIFKNMSINEKQAGQIYDALNKLNIYNYGVKDNKEFSNNIKELG